MFDKNHVGATILDYTYIEQNDDALMEAIAKVGPISIAINSSIVMQTFDYYKSGKDNFTKIYKCVLVTLASMLRWIWPKSDSAFQ